MANDRGKVKKKEGKKMAKIAGLVVVMLVVIVGIAIFRQPPEIPLEVTYRALREIEAGRSVETLMRAARGGRTDIVNLLREHGAR